MLYNIYKFYNYIKNDYNNDCENGDHNKYDISDVTA